MSSFYYRIFGNEFGPISFELLQQEIECGRLSGDHEVRHGEETSWIRVAEFLVQGTTKENPTGSGVSSNFVSEGGHENIATEVSVFTEVTVCEISAIETAEPLAETADSSMNSKTEADIERSAVSSPPQQPEPEFDATAALWYARMGRVERGPMDFEKLADMAFAGHILPTDRVRQADKSEWVIAQAIPGLFSKEPSTKSNRSVPPSVESSTHPSVTSPVGSAANGSSHRTARSQTYAPAVGQRGGPTSWPSSFPPSITFAVQPSDVQPSDLQPSDLTIEQVQPVVQSHEPPLQPREPVVQSHVPAIESRESVAHSVMASTEFPTEPARQTVQAESKSRHVQIEEEEPDEEDDSSEQSISQKHRIRRGQYREPQIIDQKTFVTLVIVVVLLFYGWSLIPASVGQFEAPHSELVEIYYALNKKMTQIQGVDAWIVIKKEFAHKISSVEQKIRKLNSQNEIRAILIGACYHMKLAAKNDDGRADRHIELARDQLRTASEILQKWNEVQKK